MGVCASKKELKILNIKKELDTKLLAIESKQNPYNGEVISHNRIKRKYIMKLVSKMDKLYDKDDKIVLPAEINAGVICPVKGHKYDWVVKIYYFDGEEYYIGVKHAEIDDSISEENPELPKETPLFGDLRILESLKNPYLSPEDPENNNILKMNHAVILAGKIFKHTGGRNINLETMDSIVFDLGGRKWNVVVRPSCDDIYVIVVSIEYEGSV